MYKFSFSVKIRCRIDPKLVLGKTKTQFGAPFFLFCVKIDTFEKNRFFVKKVQITYKFLNTPESNFYVKILVILDFFHEKSILFKSIDFYAKKKKRGTEMFLSSQNNFGVNTTHILDRETEFRLRCVIHWLESHFLIFKPV